MASWSLNPSDELVVRAAALCVGDWKSNQGRVKPVTENTGILLASLPGARLLRSLQ